MTKIINITSISLKEFAISKNDNKLSVSLYYSLLDETGKEYDQKRDQITDENLTTAIKNHINNTLNFIETKIKKKEGIEK